MIVRPPERPTFTAADGRLLEERVTGARVRFAASEDEALWLAPEADALALFRWFPRRFWAAARRLRWVHSFSVGVNDLLTDEMLDAPVCLTNSRGMNAPSIADHAFALLLGLTRRLRHGVEQQRERCWQRYEADELPGKTMGIIGFGCIGREVARRARGFGMTVLAIRARPRPDELAHAVWPPDRLDEVLARSDVVVLAPALTPATRRMIGAEQFRRMKPGAYFLNVSRGECVDEAALVAALRSGHLAAAGLDALDPEPPRPDSPLWAMPNVLITPHSAALSPQTRERLLGLLAENLRRFVAGEELLNVVDKRLGY